MKRPASQSLAIAPKRAKRAINATDSGPKVNIREIMKLSVVNSGTRDAFLRKGWEIGLKVAKGNGFEKALGKQESIPKLGTRQQKTTWSQSTCECRKVIIHCVYCRWGGRARDAHV